MNTRRGNSAGAPDKLGQTCAARHKNGHGFRRGALQNDNEPFRRRENTAHTDSRDEAVCVIRTTKVSVVPFCDVSAASCFLRGEGDRSLAYWRKVHEEFFRDEYEACGLEFSQDIPVVCEEFELLMKAAEC